LQKPDKLLQKKVRKTKKPLATITYKR